MHGQDDDAAILSGRLGAPFEEADWPLRRVLGSARPFGFAERQSNGDGKAVDYRCRTLSFATAKLRYRILRAVLEPHLKLIFRSV